jgi:hypothetical protein
MLRSLVHALAREPLFHFAALGAALFVAYAALAPAEPAAPRHIVVTSARVEQLAAAFGQIWQRPPTEAELADQIDEFVREEVFYREALAMGLDRDDAIVRRRMRQKLAYLAEDLSGAADPSDDELRRTLAAHPERYRREPRLALHQIAVRRDGADAAQRARSLLARLRAGDDTVRGDPTLLPDALPLSSRSAIAAVFGDDFAGRVFGLAPGSWSGPIESGVALHLVRVDAREEARDASLDEVRSAVRRDWIEAHRKEADDAFYRKLRARYDVTVEPAPGAATSTRTAAGAPR